MAFCLSGIDILTTPHRLLPGEALFECVTVEEASKAFVFKCFIFMLFPKIPVVSGVSLKKKL